MLYKSRIYMCSTLEIASSLFLLTLHRNYKLSSSLEDIASSTPAGWTSSPSGSSCRERRTHGEIKDYSNISVITEIRERHDWFEAIVFHVVVLNFKYLQKIYIPFHTKKQPIRIHCDLISAIIWSLYFLWHGIKLLSDIPWNIPLVTCIFFWYSHLPKSLCAGQDHTRDSWDIPCCYIAGVFPATAHPFIG